MLPVFLVGFVVYRFRDPIIFLDLIVLSVISTFAWLKVINYSKNYTLERYEITWIYDRYRSYLIYVLSLLCILSLFSLGIGGLITFFCSLAIYSTVYIISDDLYFNLILFILGYRYFRVSVAGGIKIYVISRHRIDLGQSISVYKVTDYIYLAQ